MSELVLQSHPEHGAGAYQLLLDGHDLSEIVNAGGVTLDWHDGRPHVTITLAPDRIQLDGVAAEFVETLMAADEKQAEPTSRS